MHTRTFLHLPTRSAPVGPLLLLLGAMCASGSAQAAKTTGAWQKNVPHNQSFTRVLVVGVSPNVNQRCAFEYLLASQMNSESVKAVRSCDVVKQKDPLTLESIKEAVESYNADAVLATSLVAREWDTNEGGSRDTRGSALYKATGSGYATGYYGVYGVPVIYGEFVTAASITTVTGEVTVTTKLYETRGATLVYSLNTKAKDIETRDSGLSEIAEAIADRLRRDKLIR
jgi:altronate dehydratase